MAINTAHFAYCDTEGCPNGERAFPDAIGLSSRKELRGEMRGDGWKRREGKDLCPYCARLGTGWWKS